MNTKEAKEKYCPLMNGQICRANNCMLWWGNQTTGDCLINRIAEEKMQMKKEFIPTS